MLIAVLLCGPIFSHRFFVPGEFGIIMFISIGTLITSVGAESIDKFYWIPAIRPAQLESSLKIKNDLSLAESYLMNQ
jgi:hypothetical protein